MSEFRQMMEQREQSQACLNSLTGKEAIELVGKRNAKG